MRSAKILPLVLERELYERIERDALEQERDAVQQCRFLIKRGLAAQEPPATLTESKTAADSQSATAVPA